MANRFGEAMQSFNQELIQCIEDLKATKCNLEVEIDAEEAEKCRLEREVERINGRIIQLKESLNKKSAARMDYENTIQESESAYMKILESSQLLLNMVKREVACLDQNLTRTASNCSSSFAGTGTEIARFRNPRDTFDCNSDNDACRKSTSVTDDHVRKKKSNDAALKT